MTDRLFDTVPVQFVMVKGVPADLVDAPDAETPVDYLRLATGVTRSREFRKFRKAVGPLALAWWVGLLVVTKRDGTFGVLEVDDVELSVEATGGADHADDVAAMLRAADAAGLVWTYETDDAFMVRVRKWSEWQPRTPKERQRLRRARSVTPEESPSRDSVTKLATAPPVTTHDSTGLNSTSPPNGGSRVGARTRGADDPVLAAMVDLYPGEVERASAAVDAVWFAAGMRKAQFRFGLKPDALVYGVRAAVAARARGFNPEDPVAFIVSQAKRWDPQSPDLTLPTRENGDPRDRPTIERDPDFARFDG